MESDMRERIAKAIYEARNGRGCLPWPKQIGSHKAPYLADAGAVLTAIGETHVLVAREPTPEMASAGFDACVAEWPDEQCRAEVPHIYRAMIAAEKEGE